MYTNEILNKIKELQPSYLPLWSPDDHDAGWAIARTFANLLSGIEEQKDKLPQKLFIAYLDSLGFTQNPPLAAKTPVTFLLTKNFKGSALIPKGTLIVSKSKVNFETTKSITASTAKLVTLVDSAFTNNKTYINDHEESLASNKSFTLFSTTAENHYIYFGDDSLFNIHKIPKTGVGLTFTVPATSGTWEYYGQENEDEEPRWYTFRKEGDSDDKTTLNKAKFFPTVKKKVNGVESYWIRTKFDSSINSAMKIKFSSSSNIDALFHNDRPLSTKASKPIFPFGKIPQTNDSFYIASREAFSKKGFKITITIANTNKKLSKDVLSIEYWNGKSWKYLKTNPPTGTDNIGTIKFTSPNDIAPNKVNGEENFWIRLRLLDNSSYVTYKCDNSKNLAPVYTPPKLKITKISVEEKYKTPQHIYEFKGNKFYKYPLSDQGEDPTNKSLYFAFDKPFGTGLFSMYIDIVENESSKNKSLEWLYCSSENAWKDLEAKDGTNGFTQSGYCQFIAPDGQERRDLFGLSAYWIKVVFGNGNEPSLNGIYPNSIETKEGKTIDSMLLGASDGSGSQKFILSDTPLFDLKLWVLETSLPDGYEGYEDTFGDGYWVLWSQVERLGYASATARVFTLDSFSGEVHFGNDKEGKIPVMGKDNILVSYRTGGGKRGNVLAGEVTKLVDTVAFVDKVNNPIDASGGADLQSIENLMEMAPKRIKHRYRAVSREDYTYIVREAFSDVAKVSVLKEGLGKLDLYIVPFSKQRKPQLSLGLKNTVQKYIDCVSPATATVTVKEPTYMALNLNITLKLVNLSFASTMKNSINATLERFLHPIEGNHDGNGWEFGTLPSLADFYQLFVEIEGIKIIASLKVVLPDYTSNPKENYALNDQSIPILSKHELICNGKHNITLKTEVHNEPCHT